MPIERDAKTSYAAQGPGVGAGGEAVKWLEEKTGIVVDRGHGVLEVGFGQGGLIDEALLRGCSPIAGVDIATACVESWRARRPEYSDHVVPELLTLDVSHEPLPHADDIFDFAFCTETIEHLANPLHAVAEVKRTLKHEGIFVLAFPMPEDNLGYDGGMHSHPYPGFLLKDSFERFMKQLYFKLLVRKENGSSAWYAFKNYKGEGIVDVFSVLSGNYTEEGLYGCLNDF